MSSTSKLTEKARFLRNASPQAFDEFLKVFAEYTEATVVHMITATENWQLYQGHVQQCIKLRQAFEEAKNG